MAYGIFLSELTGFPLKKAVMLPDGALLDQDEIDKISLYEAPWLNEDGLIVDNEPAGENKTNLLTIKKCINEKKHITVHFLQPILDRAYHQAAWPKSVTLDETVAVNEEAELARLLLKEIKQLSYKHEALETFWSGWPNTVIEQRKIIDELSLLDQSLYLEHLPDKALKFDLYLKAAQKLFDISKRALSFGRNTDAELLWHNLITGKDEKFDVTAFYKRIMAEKLNKKTQEIALPDFEIIILTTPFDHITAAEIDHIFTCNLSGKKAKKPIIFENGMLYDRDVLWQYLHVNLTKKWENFAEFQARFPVLKPALQLKGNFTPYNPESLNIPAAATASNHDGTIVAIPLQAMHALFPLEGDFMRFDFMIQITPKLEDNKYTFKGNQIWAQTLDEKIIPELGCLIQLKIISKYKIENDRVFMFGFDETSLIAQANLAMLMLLKVKQLTEKGHHFKNHYIYKSSRAISNPSDDDGSLPDQVFYQRMAVQEMLDKLNIEITNDTDGITNAFECLAIARKVIDLGHDQNLNNNSSIFRDVATKCWYKIFTAGQLVFFEEIHKFTFRKQKLLAPDYKKINESMCQWEDAQLMLEFNIKDEATLFEQANLAREFLVTVKALTEDGNNFTKNGSGDENGKLPDPVYYQSLTILETEKIIGLITLADMDRERAFKYLACARKVIDYGKGAGQQWNFTSPSKNDVTQSWYRIFKNENLLNPNYKKITQAVTQWAEVNISNQRNLQVLATAN